MHINYFKVEFSVKFIFRNEDKSLALRYRKSKIMYRIHNKYLNKATR